jgi:hypothetical protein
MCPTRLWVAVDGMPQAYLSRSDRVAGGRTQREAIHANFIIALRDGRDARRC